MKISNNGVKVRIVEISEEEYKIYNTMNHNEIILDKDSFEFWQYITNKDFINENDIKEYINLKYTNIANIMEVIEDYNNLVIFLKNDGFLYDWSE